MSQARQRIRTLEMQLAMVNAEIESSREEERRARAAALEPQEVFRRNDADRAEVWARSPLVGSGLQPFAHWHGQ